MGTQALLRLGADPDLIVHAPLLNAFLPLDIPENELTTAMDGRVRAENTQGLLIRLLDDTVRLGPAVLILEDAHWLDSASWALALQVSRRVPAVLLVVGMRPIAEPVPADCVALLEMPGTDRLRVQALQAADSLALACNRLGVDALPPAVANLIEHKSQGHPFFCEELTYALRDLGLIQIEGSVCRPARRCRLERRRRTRQHSGSHCQPDRSSRAAHQLTLKVSSVIGRLFPMCVLRDIYPIESDRSRLLELLDDLTDFDFTLREAPEPDLAFLFKHVTIQEVSYDMLLFARRRQLHESIARWYEQTHSADLSAFYPLLAHHWTRAEVACKAIDYLEVAGAQAMRGGAYQEAVLFLRDAIRLDPGDGTEGSGLCGGVRRAQWQAKLGEAYLGLGRLVDSREHTALALQLLGHPLPGTRTQLVAQFAIELARQAMHWLAPSWFLGRSREAIEILRWSARACDVACQICYYSQEVAPGAFSALRALNLAEASGPCPELARSYGTMCIMAGMVPLHSLAEAYGRRAQETALLIDDLSTRAWVAQAIGMYWLTVGRWQQSREKLTEAVDTTRRLGDWRRWEESLTELARLEFLQGDFQLGARLFQEVESVARQRGHDQVVGWSLHGQSTCLLRLGQTERAAGMLKTSPALEPGYTNIADMILGRGLLALARLLLGHCDLARQDAEEALRLMEQTRPMANFNMEGYAATAEVFLTLWEQSVQTFGSAPRPLRAQAHTACKSLRQFARVFPMAQPRAWAWWGWLQYLSRRPRQARSSWRAAMWHAQELKMPFEEALIHREIGRHAGPGLDPPPDPSPAGRRDLRNAGCSRRPEGFN